MRVHEILTTRGQQSGHVESVAGGASRGGRRDMSSVDKITMGKIESKAEFEKVRGGVFTLPSPPPPSFLPSFLPSLSPSHPPLCLSPSLSHDGFSLPFVFLLPPSFFPYLQAVEKLEQRQPDVVGAQKIIQRLEEEYPDDSALRALLMRRYLRGCFSSLSLSFVFSFCLVFSRLCFFPLLLFFSPFFPSLSLSLSLSVSCSSLCSSPLSPALCPLSPPRPPRIPILDWPVRAE